MSAMADIYTVVKHVLKNTAAITALVPTDNIRPSEDRSAPGTGSMIYYNWQDGLWDVKARRGQGTFGISCGAVDTKVDANTILDLVREALTARALTYSGGPLRVSLFKEIDSQIDSGTTDGGRSLAATTFDVKFVEA
jgi:hypothetical protein